MTHIILLTEPRCDLCDRAKEILHYLSAEFEFLLTEIDLASDEGRELAMRHIVLFAPSLIIDGELFGYGRISEHKLRQTLASIRSTGA
ncbi:glutaredoxin family protein [Glycomyces tenuis]|uniref:glutaredoxin family protein n=1 Tax=Glycomyces tenuis TaxID=58116 RepID=UPI0004237DC6|nr:glutaredoxin family protein [Glycomyces tenuis]